MRQLMYKSKNKIHKRKADEDNGSEGERQRIIPILSVTCVSRVNITGVGAR